MRLPNAAIITGYHVKFRTRVNKPKFKSVGYTRVNRKVQTVTLLHGGEV